MAIWWCNQTRDWQQEWAAGVVCAGESAKNTYRRTVGEVQPGDIIVHYRKPYVSAFSRALEAGHHQNPLPLVQGHDYGAGWRFNAQYYILPVEDRIRLTPGLRQQLAAAIPIGQAGFAVNPNGWVKMGYFFRFNEQGLAALLGAQSHQPYPGWLIPVRA